MAAERPAANVRDRYAERGGKPSPRMGSAFSDRSAATWHSRAQAILDLQSDNPLDQGQKDAWLALVNERLDAEGLRGKVWGAMHYVCERCCYVEYREMEVGVEGPPHWKDDLTYIASAFSAGRHDDCGGVMSHKHFGSDVEYDEPREATARAVFRVPREWPTYPTRGIYEDGTVIVGVADSAFLSLNLAGTR